MVSIASKCRGRPFLNFLDPPLVSFFSRPCTILNLTAPVFQLGKNIFLCSARHFCQRLNTEKELFSHTLHFPLVLLQKGQKHK